MVACFSVVSRRSSLAIKGFFLYLYDDDIVVGSGHEDRATDSPGHIHVSESTDPDPTGSFYGVALIAAVGAAIAMAVLGMSVGWYTLVFFMILFSKFIIFLCYYISD